MGKKFKDAIAKSTVVLCLVFFMGCGVISYAIARLLVAKKLVESESRFVGEADLNPVSFVTMLVSSIWGLTTGQEEKVLKRARYVAGLMAGGTVVANVGAFAFSLLPTALQEAIQWKFGSADFRMKYRVNNWKATASALLQFSTVPRVINSEYFKEHVRESLKEGSVLVDDLSAPKFTALRDLIVTGKHTGYIS